MTAMLIDYWTQFSDSPLWTVLKWTIASTYIAYAITVDVHRRCAPGTYRAYQSATVIRMLLWPLFAGYTFSAALNVFTADWFGTVICVLVCAILLRDWQRFKDSDDWWKGKGTKLKKKLKSLVTGPASVPAAAGA